MGIEPGSENLSHGLGVNNYRIEIIQLLMLAKWLCGDNEMKIGGQLSVYRRNSAKRQMRCLSGLRRINGVLVAYGNFGLSLKLSSFRASCGIKCQPSR